MLTIRKSTYIFICSYSNVLRWSSQSPGVSGLIASSSALYPILSRPYGVSKRHTCSFSQPQKQHGGCTHSAALEHTSRPYL